MKLRRTVTLAAVTGLALIAIGTTRAEACGGPCPTTTTTAETVTTRTFEPTTTTTEQPTTTTAPHEVGTAIVQCKGDAAPHERTVGEEPCAPLTFTVRPSFTG